MKFNRPGTIGTVGRVGSIFRSICTLDYRRDFASRLSPELAPTDLLPEIEPAHAGVGLHPDDDVERDEAEVFCSDLHGRQAAPVDIGAQDAALADVGSAADIHALLKSRNSTSVISPDAMTNSPCVLETWPLIGTL